jgi:putative ABC transport system permease protein
VGAEITFAVVLLVGAGLMVRGFRAQVDTGARLDPSTLLTMRLALAGDTYREPHQVYGFYRDALSRIGAVPGVRSAAAVTALPYSGRSESSPFTIEGRAVEPANVPRAMYQAASPSYFEAARIPLRAGRLLGEGDGPEAPRVAVVSERLASRWWPNESPVGKHIRVGGADSKGPWLTVVGVVGDITHSPYDREPRPAFYVPYQQSPPLSMNLAVRTEGDPLSLARGVMAAIHEVDHEQPVTDVRTMETAIYNSAIGLNFMAALMGVFGLLALCLSAVGVYGVMAHLVSEQTREIGIRIALGARWQNVFLFVFRRGLVPVAAGLLIGLPLAWGFSRFLASVIYGVTATDPVTFVGVPAALLAAGLLAIILPARRAMKIDPVHALRGS